IAYIFCDEEVFGISGESFTFPVKSDKKITEVIWTKNKDKVAEWEGQGEPVYFTSLQERGLLDKGSGSLTIFNLENTDTGTYVLECIFSDGKNDVLTFTLAVLAPPSEPQISCNISGDNLVLTCAADFKKPLNYSWKISGIPTTAWDQEVLIPKEKVDAVEKAACFIKYSQIEKSSEITLDQCIP
ncbi:LFA3 protein, partial [Anseranas semipalmata]|nr:LFA3 protein [Anseranas semipalmata]